ncbi:MAG: 50S ribosomal protein L10 [Candidatus Falkowbacteria bacterium]
MAKSKAKKQVELRSLSEKAKTAKAVVFATFNALGVKQSETVRDALRAENGEMIVAKKTLVSLAFKSQDLGEINLKQVDGQLAVLFGYGDEISPAKLLAKYKKEFDNKLDFAGGILEGKFITSSEVAALAALPSKQELYARLVGTINAPVSGFVNALAGNLRNLVYVLKAVEEQKA